VALKHDLLIISDEIYERLTYDGASAVSIAALSPEVKRRTITVNGFSKAYAMTGWRLGYAAAEKPIAQAMAELQSHSTSGPSSITQKAALAGLEGDQRYVETMRVEFDRRRRYAIERMRGLPGFRLEIEPRGAFYVFPNVSELFGRTVAGHRIQSDDDLCSAILESAQVAVVPGGSFGSPNHIRISYATSMEKLRTGLDRIENLLRAESPVLA
ncbi:MAG TPA: aminotransferase class I/II-fold pyridoxal phosphate-dependent enzyme, partial [Candidatus Eremiobacteraceae bacterium]|nr:aminotransferase class I/II-fold pyridoxal phosphate-dependent enzyme [Candidatus Eremiobacteraceae bacterium]